MSIVNFESTKIDVLIYGTGITTPIKSQVLVFKNPTNIRKSPPDLAFISLADCGITETLNFDRYASTNMTSLYENLQTQPAGYSFVRNYRLKERAGHGFDVEFLKIDNPVRGFQIFIHRVVNGQRNGSFSATYGRYYSHYQPETWSYVGYINQTNFECYQVPVICYDNELDPQLAYVGAYFGDIDNPPNTQGAKVATQYAFAKATIDTSSAPTYPYPTEDEESGEGSQDDSSDDIQLPDNALTDEITTILNGNGVITTYKLTPTQWGLLSSEMWDNTFITDLKKVFTNPMDAIVSCFLLPFSVSSATTSNHIALGGLELLAAGYLVARSQETIDCGTISLPEYWGSFLDYDATSISIYLPFVGIQKLSVQALQGGSLHVVYKVDVLSGAFICFLQYVKNGRTQILNTFSGNMALQIPITSMQHGNVVQALSQVANGVASVASGQIPTAVASVSSGVISSLQSNVSTIGNYSNNIGFMGVRTPYLIVERAKAQIPANINKVYGVPSHKWLTLKNCHGYTKVSDIELGNLGGATFNEIQKLETLLKNGVILP